MPTPYFFSNIPTHIIRDAKLFLRSNSKDLNATFLMHVDKLLQPRELIQKEPQTKILQILLSLRYFLLQGLPVLQDCQILYHSLGLH